MTHSRLRSKSLTALVALAIAATVPSNVSAGNHVELLGALGNKVSNVLSPSNNDSGSGSGGDSGGSGGASVSAHVSVGAGGGSNDRPQSNPSSGPSSSPSESPRSSADGSIVRQQAARIPQPNTAAPLRPVAAAPAADMINLVNGGQIRPTALVNRLVFSRDGQLLGVVANAGVGGTGLAELQVNIRAGAPVSARAARLQMMVIRQVNTNDVMVPLTAQEFYNSVN